MDKVKALEIVSALADGHNPYTGEVFENDSVFQNPDTVRALFIARDALMKQITHDAKKKKLPENVGATWTQEEEDELLKAFDAGTSVKDLAIKHARTKGAIESRLAKCGKLSNVVLIRYKDRKTE